MTVADRDEVAELIYLSTNWWYQCHDRGSRFFGGPEVARVYFDVYEALDPGCGIVAVSDSGRMMGSCFYRERETHVSLGIMNAHPNYAGRGVAAALLKWICDFADRRDKPVRLVSSAMNLDSFSLYTRQGFSPRRVHHDMQLAVPAEGFNPPVPGRECVREARPGDVDAMVALEFDIAGIRRGKDFAHFIANPDGLWHVSVFEVAGRMEGFCASCASAACNMVGPGVARTSVQVAALLAVELDRHRGRKPVWLAPADCEELIRTCYEWGARNCELHLAQVRGPSAPFHGVTLPTFLPESA